MDTVLPNFKERALQEVFGEAPEKAKAQMGDLLQRELETVQFLNRVRISTAQELSLLHAKISPPGFSSPWPDPIARIGEKHLLVAPGQCQGAALVRRHGEGMGGEMG